MTQKLKDKVITDFRASDKILGAKEINQNGFSSKFILYKFINYYWWIKHLFRCEEKYLTEPYMIRFCSKCHRFTLEDKRLREAFKKDGIEGLFEEMKKRSTVVGNSPPREA